MKRLLISFCLFISIALHAYAADTMFISIDKYQIAVPVGWLAQYTKDQIVFVLYSPLEENDTFQENCNLTTETLKTQMTLSEYIKLSVDTLKGIYKDLRIQAQKDNYLVYTGTMDGGMIKQLQYYYINNTEAYVLTCSSDPANYARYEKTFRQIAGTFRYK